MTIRFWGTRGSIPTFNNDTQTFGGNTSCVTIVDDGVMVILDAGSGVKILADSNYIKFFHEFHILLTHMHFDHIQGLGFFSPFFNPKNKINIYGPASNSDELIMTLTKYLSPPLFPVRIRDLKAELQFFAMPRRSLKIGHLEIESAFVCHPGPTLGYRINDEKHTVTYIPDHEVSLGTGDTPKTHDWTSGFDLAHQADVLIHDAQYDHNQYLEKVGWGHSSFPQTIQFAREAKVKKLYFFHHDPMHSDQRLQEMHKIYVPEDLPFEAKLAKESDTIELG
ncbi:MAG: MBL fold metallo-hydrolase [Saprospiraceae bacterium]|nr:MBL fold metallo-hydrolase [Saprospiraceae bacterium]